MTDGGNGTEVFPFGGNQPFWDTWAPLASEYKLAKETWRAIPNTAFNILIRYDHRAWQRKYEELASKCNNFTGNTQMSYLEQKAESFKLNLPDINALSPEETFFEQMGLRNRIMSLQNHKAYRLLQCGFTSLSDETSAMNNASTGLMYQGIESLPHEELFVVSKEPTHFVYEGNGRTQFEPSFSNFERKTNAENYVSASTNYVEGAKFHVTQCWPQDKFFDLLAMNAGYTSGSRIAVRNDLVFGVAHNLPVTELLGRYDYDYPAWVTGTRNPLNCHYGDNKKVDLLHLNSITQPGNAVPVMNYVWKWSYLIEMGETKNVLAFIHNKRFELQTKTLGDGAPNFLPVNLWEADFAGKNEEKEDEETPLWERILIGLAIGIAAGIVIGVIVGGVVGAATGSVAGGTTGAAAGFAGAEIATAETLEGVALATAEGASVGATYGSEIAASYGAAGAASGATAGAAVAAGEGGVGAIADGANSLAPVNTSAESGLLNDDFSFTEVNLSSSGDSGFQVTRNQTEIDSVRLARLMENEAYDRQGNFNLLPKDSVDRAKQTEDWVRKTALQYFNENQKPNLKTSQLGPPSTSFRMPTAPQGVSSGVTRPPTNAETVGNRVGNFFRDIVRTPLRTKFRRFFGQEFYSEPKVVRLTYPEKQTSRLSGDIRAANLSAMSEPGPRGVRPSSNPVATPRRPLRGPVSEFAIVDGPVAQSTPKPLPFDFTDGAGNSFISDNASVDDQNFIINANFERSSEAGSGKFVRSLFDLHDGSNALDWDSHNSTTQPINNFETPLDFTDTNFETATQNSLEGLNRMATRAMRDEAFNVAENELGENAPLQEILDRYHQILGQMRMTNALNRAFGVNENLPLAQAKPQATSNVEKGGKFPDRAKCGLVYTGGNPVNVWQTSVKQSQKMYSDGGLPSSHFKWRWCIPNSETAAGSVYRNDIIDTPDCSFYVTLSTPHLANPLLIPKAPLPSSGEWPVPAGTDYGPEKFEVGIAPLLLSFTFEVVESVEENVVLYLLEQMQQEINKLSADTSEKGLENDIYFKPYPHFVEQLEKSGRYELLEKEVEVEIPAYLNIPKLNQVIESTRSWSPKVKVGIYGKEFSEGDPNALYQYPQSREEPIVPLYQPKKKDKLVLEKAKTNLSQFRERWITNERLQVKDPNLEDEMRAGLKNLHFQFRKELGSPIDSFHHRKRRIISQSSQEKREQNVPKKKAKSTKK